MLGMSGSAATARIDLLGGFAVAVGDAEVDGPWRLRKAKSLVKLLALAPGHQLHRDVLIDRLWPDVGVDSGANNLHQALHAARRVLGSTRLALRDELVVLGPDGDVVVDADTFADAALSACNHGSVEELTAALALWTGDLLPEDLYEDWAKAHRDRLTALHITVAVRLSAALVERGDAADAVVLLESLAAERPLDEEVHRACLVALVEAGRRTDAVAAYERLRDALENELGIAPAAETREVYRRLFAGGVPASAAVSHNLPAFATSFVGRSRELRELTGVFDRTRLLTLIGPGGSGKTRLAYELAARRLDPALHPDGAWLVELAGITDRALVASALATALGLSLPGGQPPAAALADQLVRRRMLLVLDNCEHLLDALVPLVSELLSRCRGLLLLATSREPLGIPGEVAWRVPSLELPTTDMHTTADSLAALESVQLFIERARNVSPSFVLDDAAAPTVARICRRLDGIPLALELAAARLNYLSLAQIDDRLSNALSILTTSRRGHLDRQQTLAATLDWSYELLVEEERIAFRRLAVFAGGFDLDAAHHLCEVDDIVDVLGRLVDKSLVMADPSGDTARYRLHEVVRQYAQALLDEAGDLDVLQRRHRRWFADQADRHDPDRGEPVVLEPSAWFDIEQDNLRAALSSATKDEPNVALRLATSTWRFWMSRGQIADALTWLTAALEECPEVSRLRAAALFATGVLYVRRAQTAPLPGIGEDLVTVFEQVGDEVDVATARHQQAIFNLMAYEWERACALSVAGEQPASLAATVGVSAHHFAGLLALAVGDLERAREEFDAALRALGHVPASTRPFFTAITVCWVVDDRGSTLLPVGEDSMLLGRRVGAEQAYGHIAAAAAIVERLSGRIPSALELLDDACRRFAALGDVYGQAYATGQHGHTLRWTGDFDGAVRCFDEAEALRVSVRDVRAIAMATAGRSFAEALSGRVPDARRGISEAIERMRQTGDAPGVALTLHDAALIEMIAGDTEHTLKYIGESLSFGHAVPVHVHGWQLLLVATLRASLGGVDSSATAAGDALASFERVGDARGIRALQRACKEGRITMSSSD